MERFRQRHRSARHEATGPMPDATPIAEVLGQVLQRLGLAEQQWMGALEEEWPRIAGPPVAKHCRPGKFDRKKLTVFVDNSVWFNELKRYGGERLLENLQKRFGRDRIESVVFELDPEGGQSRKSLDRAGRDS